MKRRTESHSVFANTTSLAVPEIRIRSCNSGPVRPEGDFVLYWMIAARRIAWNFALDRAVEWAGKLRKPLVILEALRCGYPWASDRLHHFIFDGMADNARRLEGSGVLHYPFVESEPDAGKGLLQAISQHACVVVTDEFPCFFLPQMVAAAARQIPVRMEAIDSNGLFPMRAADRVFPTAHAFRRHLQKNLPLHLMEFPKADPLSRIKFPAAKAIPREISARWPRASAKSLQSASCSLATLPINHKIPTAKAPGGAAAGQAALKKFLRNKLSDYPEARNEPEQDASSGLSPYLHFGHVSAHQVFLEIARLEQWSPRRLSLRANGSRTGWWGVRPAADAFLDQLVTWRELGFNACCWHKDYDKFESLPDWALKTLGRHARDERSHSYTLDEFERAGTHDPLWNAAQTQLVREGRVHNYLRMLWGKKILEWARSPAAALEIMVELNNKYALDGRDPNSYSGIFWCLGRYDRPWGPERPIFGTVRYMTSENTARKFRVKDYIRRYAS
jgi:deoxyribodipyrimidine photo-lyase